MYPFKNENVSYKVISTTFVVGPLRTFLHSCVNEKAYLLFSNIIKKKASYCIYVCICAIEHEKEW